MKKILAVSLVAIMAAGAARADIASTIYVQKKISNLDAAEIMGENEVIMSVAETDGIISATTGKITESHLDFDVATQGELDAVASAAAGAKSAADAAQATADANATAIGTKDAEGKYTSGLGSRVESLEDEIATLSGGVGSVGTQIDNKINALDVDEIKAENEVILSVSETDGKISATTGKITESHLSFEVATQAELNAVESTANQGVSDAAAALAAAQGAQSTANTAKSTAEANALKIGDIDSISEEYGDTLVGAVTYVRQIAESAIDGGTAAEQSAARAQGAANDAQKTADQNKDDIGAEYEWDDMGNIIGINNLETEADTLVPAINEVKGLADAAQGTADGAASAAAANAGNIGNVNDLTTTAKTLVPAINEVKGLADAAQATADLKVNKSSLGIVEDAENPFNVPDWCKGNGVVCSFVVFDGVAGWQQVVDEDPDA